MECVGVDGGPGRCGIGWGGGTLKGVQKKPWILIITWWNLVRCIVWVKYLKKILNFYTDLDERIKLVRIWEFEKTAVAGWLVIEPRDGMHPGTAPVAAVVHQLPRDHAARHRR